VTGSDGVGFFTRIYCVNGYLLTIRSDDLPNGDYRESQGVDKTERGGLRPLKYLTVLKSRHTSSSSLYISNLLFVLDYNEANFTSLLYIICC
jgi:hypothetical protein